MRCVDAGFAANGGVDLGEEGCGDLDEGKAAEGGRGGEAGEVADHASAQGDDGGAALDPLFEELAGESGKGFKISWRPRRRGR